MKKLLLTTLFSLLSVHAFAACTPTINTATGVVSVDVSSCTGVQITGLPGGAGNVTIDGSGNITSDGGAQQTQINNTISRLNNFNGSTETIENWATGVNSTLANYGAEISQNTANISKLFALYNGQQLQINSLNSQMKKAFAGIAGATAYEAPQVDPGKTFGFSLNYADYQGWSALSAVGKWRINNNIAVTGGTSLMQEGVYSFKVGAQVQW